jgi:hypothetical protein
VAGPGARVYNGSYLESKTVSSSMEVFVLPLGGPGWPGRTWRVCAAGLLMLLVLTACRSQPIGPASADRPSASTATQSGTCQPDEGMGRPCPNGDDPVAGEESEEYGAGAGSYHGELYEECAPFLRRSFTAFKACARY